MQFVPFIVSLYVKLGSYVSLILYKSWLIFSGINVPNEFSILNCIEFYSRPLVLEFQPILEKSVLDRHLQQQPR